MINPIETIQIYSQLKPYSQRRKVEEMTKSKKNDNKFVPKDTWEPNRVFTDVIPPFSLNSPKKW